MRLKTLFGALFITSLLVLSACQAHSIKASAPKHEARWYDTRGFNGVDSIGTSPYDLEFDLSYFGAVSDTVRVRNCLEVSSLGDNKISEREFVRWDSLKTDCEAAQRFYDAPEDAFSYWPSTFDLSLLKTFPATSIPYLGGQGLDDRKGDLAKHISSLTLIESSERGIKVFYDGIVVSYGVVARGDFNRDGYQDLFVRMDWYVEGAFGDGIDWVVLTKLSFNTAPMMLWRK